MTQLHPKKPIFTVAIPARNAENYLETALESVLAQSFRSFETVISDNNSSDRTQEILQQFAIRFAAVDMPLKIIRHDRDLTLGDNLNSLIKNSQGEWIKFLCHDDTLRPHALGNITLAIETSDLPHLGLVGNVDCQRLADGTVLSPHSDRAENSAILGRTLVRQFVLGQGHLPLPALSNATVRREVFAHLAFDHRFDHCDTFLWLNMLCTWDYMWLTEILGDTTIHGQQLTNEIRRSGKSVAEHATFWPEFVREHGSALNLSLVNRAMVLLRPASWAANQAVFVAIHERSFKGFLCLTQLPLAWWPAQLLVLPRAILKQTLGVLQTNARTSAP